MITFKSTYLYIKRHSITGKLYFGKTSRDPEKYLGSGKRWTYHIKKHGVEHVETLWYCLFLDEDSIKEFALSFSKQHNIVESEDWLNLIDENGLDGGNRCKSGKDHPAYGMSRSIESRMKMSQCNSGQNNPMHGKRHSDLTVSKMSIAKKGKSLSEEQKKTMRIPKKTTQCPHCNKIGGSNIMHRYHFDNCKNV